MNTIQDYQKRIEELIRTNDLLHQQLLELKNLPIKQLDLNNYENNFKIIKTKKQIKNKHKRIEEISGFDMTPAITFKQILNNEIITLAYLINNKHYTKSMTFEEFHSHSGIISLYCKENNCYLNIPKSTVKFEIGLEYQDGAYIKTLNFFKEQEEDEVQLDDNFNHTDIVIYNDCYYEFIINETAPYKLYLYIKTF